MEKVSRKTTKLCSFYVSDWHLVTMLLPYLNEEINKENKIVTLLETNINMNISIFYEKCDTSKVIKELTYNIGNVGAELKQFNDNRQDIDIAAFTYNDAKYIRKEIQINNEKMYFLYIYLRKK